MSSSVFHLPLPHLTYANPDERYCLSGFFLLAFSLQHCVTQAHTSYNRSSGLPPSLYQLSRQFTSMNAPILSNILSPGSTSTPKISYRFVFRLSLLYSTHTNPDGRYCSSGFFFLAFSLQNGITKAQMSYKRSSGPSPPPIVYLDVQVSFPSATATFDLREPG